VYGRDQYRTAATETAGPAQLVLMLYDGALGRLQIAATAIADGDIGAAHTSLVGAQAIVDELNLTLDLDRGGQLAGNLRRLYGYCSERLLEANLVKDPAIVVEVAGLLETLRDAWNQACVLVPVPG
jgi:flagellar secretion chaperone FliS